MVEIFRNVIEFPVRSSDEILKKVKGRKALHLYQLRDQAAVRLPADAEIHLQENCMRVLTRHFQPRNDSPLRQLPEIRPDDNIADIFAGLQQLML